MLPYVLLMFVPLLFSFISFSSSFTEYNGKWSVSLGKKREILDHSCLLPVFFMILTVLLSLRHIKIGNDTANYKFYFDRFSNDRLSDMFASDTDPLYFGLNWLVGRFTHNFQWFLSVVAVLSIIPVAKLFCEDREHGYLKVALFVNMSNFVMMFSGLRQTLAISAGVLAYMFVRKKKLLPFLLMAIVAMGFHHSGFVVFTFYPLYHITLKKKHLWFIIPGLLSVFIFNRFIFGWAVSILTSVLGDKYDVTLQETGAYTMIILFALLLLLAYILPDEKRMDRETIGLRNFLIVALILQCFAPVHTLAMRMNYYFIIFIPILIPKVLKYTRSPDLAWMANIVMTGFFAIYFLFTVYTGCQTDGGTLNTFPYIPFWK